MIQAVHQSHLSMWARCPEQFRRRYLEGEVMPPGIAARIGTGVHKGAEVYNRGKMEGQVEPEGAVVDAAVEGYKDSCLKGGVFFSPEEAPSAKAVLAQGVDETAGLTRLFYREVAPGLEPVAVEETIVMNAGLPLPFAGTVDWRETDPAVWADLKTANAKWSQDKADAEIQPTLYPRLIESKTGVLPVNLRYEVLVKNKALTHQRINTSRSDEDWALLKARAALMLRQIDAGLFPPAEPGHWCCSSRWCGYFHTCRLVSPRRKTLPKKTN